MVATRRAKRAASSASKKTGYVFCLLLAAQYGLQPFLKVFIADGVNKVSLVLGTELAKVLIGVVGMLLDGSLASNFAGWNPRGAAFAVIPSLIYAAQNYLLVFGYQSMDSITFNCLNQSKLVSTALCLYLLFGTKQSVVQMVALAGLLVAGVMLQDGGGDGGSSSKGKSSSSDAELAVGVAAVIVASALSGMASAACQYAMQRIGTPAHVFTLEMAFVAIPALLVSQAGLIAEDPAVLFRGWDARTLIPVFASAFGGICVGQVTKNLGGIAKGFAIVGGLVLTGLAQGVQEGRWLETRTLVALVLVVSCVWAHNTHPPAKPKSKRQ